VKLETARLTLRTLTVDDAEAMDTWASNPQNVRWMSWGPNTLEDSLAFLETVKPDDSNFAVIIEDTGKVIGSAGMFVDAERNEAELGWILHTDHWKQGYGSEIGAELIRHGFEDLHLRRLYAPCAAVNYGSYRVMERNGMRREAHNVKAFWSRVDEEWIDMYVYAILAEEYVAPGA
jgi:RimJ/RimL family protein N-acetyltransferase